MENLNSIEIYLNERLKEEQIKVPMLDFTTNEYGNYEFTTKIYEQPNKIGTILLDFIEKDLKETSYQIFRFFGFQTLLSEKERNELLSLNPNNSEALDNKFNLLFDKYKGEFENYKYQIIDILEYCLFNDNELFNDLSPLDKLLLFINNNSLDDYPILRCNEFNKIIKLNKDTSNKKESQLVETLKNKDSNRYEIQEIYKIDNFYNLLFLELYFILQEKTCLKKCKNCGKYFLTTNTSVIYCDNIFEAHKTCREIGASKVFSKNLENDEAYSLYRKIYKSKQALSKSKGGNFEIEYNLFKHQGKDKKNAYKLGEITKEEFIKWLNLQ